MGSCVLLASLEARGGLVADENAAPGTSDFTVVRDGTAEAAGVADLYPSAWTIARGESVGLKIRSRESFRLSVYRLGWYGGAGAHLIQSGGPYPAVDQPYPRAESTYGMVEAKWADTVTLTTDASWVPGVYVARIDLAGGMQAETFFVLRDDGVTPRAPILVVIPTATHQAYNAWPGPNLGGKSLYAFNCSPDVPSDSHSNQAVKVSFDRPFFVMGGVADLTNDQYPFVRWVERNGYEIAYATDQDLDARPAVAQGRRAIVIVGHSEYWTRPMRDVVKGARDAGTNLLFMTGDTISYQIRFEAGAGGASSTEVGYKDNFDLDPEEIAGANAYYAHDLAGAKAHLRVVTRGWKDVMNYPGFGIDERDPGMTLTGVHSFHKIHHNYPYADLVIDDASLWFFAGTGLGDGSTIKGVMGYEVDGTEPGDPTWDPYRPAGQKPFATIYDRGSYYGGSSYYKASSGAEVVAFGGIAFDGALDPYLAPVDETSPGAQRLVKNLLDGWAPGSSSTGGTPPPAPDAGVIVDASTDAAADSTIADAAADSAIADAAADSTIVDASTIDAPLDSTIVDAPIDATLADGTPTYEAPDAKADSSAGWVDPNTQGASTMAGSGCAMGRGEAGSAAAAIALAGALAMRRRRSG